MKKTIIDLDEIRNKFAQVFGTEQPLSEDGQAKKDNLKTLLRYIKPKISTDKYVKWSVDLVEFLKTSDDHPAVADDFIDLLLRLPDEKSQKMFTSLFGL